MTVSRFGNISWYNLRFLGLVAVGMFVAAMPSQAALNAYLAITANGSAIDGDSTMTEIGGVDVSTDHIECYAVHQEVFGDGAHKTHTPIKIIKRVDKSTPLLYQAFGDNETIAGTLKYFKNDPDLGATIQATNLIIKGGIITGIRHWQPNGLDTNAVGLPLMEEISITFQSLEILDVPSGKTYVLNAPAP